MSQSKKKKAKKVKEQQKKVVYNPLDNSNEQPFDEHRPYLKEAHDVGQLIWLLNNGKISLPYHEHKEEALNFNLPFEHIEKSYYNTNPNLVILDDFLNPEALQKLRNYCFEFPFWNTIYGRGYLGAFRENGFQPKVLTTLSTELMEKLPNIFNTPNKRHLGQMWAFKYESKCPGIDIHADFAAINMNLWITPTKCNVDYDKEKDIGKSGGMWIWDKGAPADWDFTRYNGDDKTEVIKYLKDNKATAIYIPYKYNRCVLFDSNLFHKTADVHFHPGFENKRINVTMLFGTRENTGVEPNDMLEVKKLKESVTKPLNDAK